MRALFIGRFQPFHRGHLSAVQQIAHEPGIDAVCIGVGSAQYAGTPDNPYSYDQRKTMITCALEEETSIIPFATVPIPDIHDDVRWVDHVCAIVGPIDVVYTGNGHVKKLFEEKNYQVKTIDRTLPISWKAIREQMRSGDTVWKTDVPDSIIHLL